LHKSETEMNMLPFHTMWLYAKQLLRTKYTNTSNLNSTILPAWPRN